MKKSNIFENVMTAYSTQDGTPSSYNPLTRLNRRLKKMDNADLIPILEFGYVEELKRVLGRPGRDLEESYVVKKQRGRLFRTPLEHAVDSNVSVGVVSELLEAGSKITLPALVLAIDAVCRQKVPFFAIEKGGKMITRPELNLQVANDICGVLTKHGADWAPALQKYGLEGQYRKFSDWPVLVERLMGQDFVVEIAPEGWSPKKARC